ncbi:VOC family protein [Burkholderia cenocepacia]|uniref:VOC family protein n=1 Tax=Burkholderia cenocepacia TaxID=95486 RepID=UPI001CF392BC|nr:VOC family protein [Burkholderia cenocepacia]MCA8405870.1 VOC family protein [Burkholderia cenocepacia]
MQLLDHVSIGVPDIDQARPFYDAVMAALGATKVYDRPNALGYGERCSASDPESTFLAVYLDPAEVGTSKRHWCFKAASREQVHAFFEAGLATGGQSDGEPGLRPQYHGDYYAAFLIDPAGNRIEAVCHAAAAERGRP